MGKVFLNTVEPENAIKIIENLPFKRKIEKVSLTEARGRVLAEDVYASINLPPFSRASMDGYAVISQDTFHASEDNPARLKLVEVVKAGDVPQKRIERGTCVEVSTGAPLPEGAEGVVMVEVTERKIEERSEDILIYESVAIGENIALEGSDIKKGDLLLSRGTMITPDKIGVLSAMGIGEVLVFKKPQVAVISTGNELIKHDEKLSYGKIYDINSHAISSAVESCGCISLHSEIVKDDFESLKSRINEFKDADIIITSGGTSAGTGDVLRTVLDEIGDVLVHGIAVKPGKPTLIGLITNTDEKKVIFGLPGYPVSALVIFQVFVAPFLKKVASLPQDKQKKVKTLKISRRYHSARGRLHYALVKIKGETVSPILKDSGAITALAQADGFIEIPKNVEIIPEGSYVDVIPLTGL